MKELLNPITAVVLALFAYLLSLSGILEYIGVTPHTVPQVAFFVAVATMLIADRLTSRLDQDRREEKLHADIQERLERWQRSIPSLNDVICYQNSDEALKYLVENIPKAIHIKNTRVVLERGIGEQPIYEQYVAIIRRSLAERRLFFDDLVSEHFSVNAKELYDYCRDGKLHGRYIYKICPSNLITINFIVLDYGQDHLEALFGWSNTTAERSIFRVTDKRLVRYFSELHHTAMERLPKVKA